MRLYSFEKLDVWQRSRELASRVYNLTLNFPAEEKFGLTNQMRRAAISVASNIAEGSSRSSMKDQARFSEIAFGSLMEVLNQLVISSDLKYLTEEELSQMRPLIEEIGNKLNSLRKFQLKQHSN